MTLEHLGILDPRRGNPARETLMLILQSLVPPANYKVTLDVDQTTEKLVLRILKRKAWVMRFLGMTFWRYTQTWEHVEAEQRRLEARTYDALLSQLQAAPEFLEFKFEVEGALQYRVATDL